MGTLVQTYLNEEENTTFELVKNFLFENQVIKKDSTYEAVKYCIKYTCSDLLARFATAEIPEGEKISKPVTSPEVEKQEIPKEEPKKEGKVIKYVIGGIDFRPNSKK